MDRSAIRLNATRATTQAVQLLQVVSLFIGPDYPATRLALLPAEQSEHAVRTAHNRSIAGREDDGLTDEADEQED